MIIAKVKLNKSDFLKEDKMKAKVIKFNNGSSIQTIQTETVVRSRPKFPTHFFMARGNNKPAISLVQMIEYCYGIELTDEEKLEIWNLFYGGDCSD